MSTHQDVVSPYGPAAPAAGRSPLVVPLDPARGWATADVPRRVAAVAALPVVVLYLAGAAATTLPGAAATLLLLAGPPAFYSLARVLRPYAPGGERTVRHWAAATSTAYSVPGLALLTLGIDDDGFGIMLALVAALGGIVTALWGLVAFLVRLAQRANRPHESS